MVAMGNSRLEGVAACDFTSASASEHQRECGPNGHQPLPLAA
jgi:hypothetical protein